MENYSLLKYTINKNAALAVQNVNKSTNYSDTIVSSNSSELAESKNVNYLFYDDTDTISIAGKIVSAYGSEPVVVAHINTIPATSLNPTENVKLSTAYKDLNPADISKIKQLIYDYHNTQIPDNTENKKTFINSSYGAFYDVDSMFTYLERITGGEITKNTGITRAQIIKLSQNDVGEDSNYDFFGTLNRIFNNKSFNTDENDVLSYSEIKNFIGDELGDDAIAYLNKVNLYANEIQTEYEALSSQEKLEYVIEKTKEYLTAAGLPKQLEALDRLISKEDTYNTSYSAKMGQIVIADIKSKEDGYITLGQYSSKGFEYNYDNTSTGKTYTGIIFGWDFDESDYDSGITLNEIMLDYNWYELVDTLVHELTHATAYMYYPDPAYEDAPDGRYYIQYSYAQLETIKDRLVAEGTYEYYKENLANIINNQDTILPLGTHEGDNAYDRLMYLLECQWGEYSAYQADADYVDSIAGDIFNGTDNIWYNNHMTTAVDGKDEANTIHEHIDDAYNKKDSIEAKPDWDWATYDKDWSWTA